MVKPVVPDLRAERLHQMASSIEALDARIAHLAIDLGVSLKNDNELVRVLTRSRVSDLPQERRGHTDFGEAARSGADLAPRTAEKWQELRGLLVLRYDVEKHCVQEMGVVATRHILVDAEEHLAWRGFNPGDDGIDLVHLLEES